MSLVEASRIPRSTYRFQLNGQFKFEDLEHIVPYLDWLGITDCYCSPIFRSAPGSTHGYDVSDYRRLNHELGGEPAFKRLSDELTARDMGLLLDFVPNHMGINGPFNPWWQNVLECGRASPYSRFFDVYWNETAGQKQPRLMIPLLEDHFGRVLERGGLKLRYESKSFRICSGDLYFPLRPSSYGRILAGLESTLSPLDAEEWARVLALFSSAEAISEAPRVDDPAAPGKVLPGLKDRLASLIQETPGLSATVDRRLEEINGKPGDATSFDQLAELIDDQHYRLVRWRAGAHEANYRRFFAIDTLVGLRIEDAEVFKESHALLAMLLQEKKITGLRIDHIDGLRDPEQYLIRIQGLQPASEKGKPLYVVVEKILQGKEKMPPTWPVHGTTGYEFITQLACLFTNSSAEWDFNKIYHSFTKRTELFEDVVYEKKRFVLEEMLGNAVTVLATSLDEILADDRRWRDLTRHELTMAIREMMAGLPVYRTYRRLNDGLLEQDRRALQFAFNRAISRNPRVDKEPFEFIRDLLLGTYPPDESSAEFKGRLFEWVLSFQQYTGAVMAKSVEDTAFYVYDRHIALNEVGGDPSVFGGTTEEFHLENSEKMSTPQSLLATSTHDTKLSEDARARLYVLSEIASEWNGWIGKWREATLPCKTRIQGRLAPDENEEYRLYQILLGAWPAVDADPDNGFRERIKQYMHKALNEAKVNSTWIEANQPWIDAIDRYIDLVLTPGPENKFLPLFRPAAVRLAQLGMVNSLAQTVLKLTSPGVPDIYQGTEIWDFSLVDPDNRRPVDYSLRKQLASEIKSRAPRELLHHWRDGAIKLYLIQTLLDFRRQHGALFSKGTYVPLKITGRFSENVVAYERDWGNEKIIVVVPRLSSKIGCPPLGLVWDDTVIDIEDEREGWSDLLTGRYLVIHGRVELAELFAELPVVVLSNRT